MRVEVSPTGNGDIRPIRRRIAASGATDGEESESDVEPAVSTDLASISSGSSFE